MNQPPASPRLLLPAFALALLLSAGLLFNIQPMIGKMLLPHVGGSPTVWNVALAFFQLALLAGYLIAHLLSRLPALQHGLIYLGALAVSVIFLPIALPAGWQPDSSGSVSLALLYILMTTVAAPFIALSLSAPTLQRLFAASAHSRASDPYFLYVASNLGSFAGLLLYPFVFEPLWNTSQQAAIWQDGMLVLIAVVAVCLLLQNRMPQAAAPDDSNPAITSSQISWKQRGMWMLLAFIPSSLTLGVTTFITSDITATPLLWVATLTLYLLTFMIAFATRGASIRRLAYKLHPWFAAASVCSVLFLIKLPSIAVVIALFAFFFTALVCHTELAARRPSADHLTDFYLCLSVGGALGGSFNAFLAPLLFTYMAEYPLILILALALNLQDPQRKSTKPRYYGIGTLIVVLGLLNLINYYGTKYGTETEAHGILVNILLAPLLASFYAPLHRFRYAGYACCALMLAFLASVPFTNSHVFMGRDFFGIITINDYSDDSQNWHFRLLQHGTTTHGVQITRPERQRTQTTSYYAKGTPLHEMWLTLQPKSIAVMGLGAGTLNCVAQPGQQVHFYEIDPLIVSVAQTYFSFLSACPPPRITIGDGRLEMAKDHETYDLIIIDAFSSDSVPVHLLTKEAIRLYMSKLNPGGVLGLHISNRFFDLEPVLAANASDLGLAALYGQTPTELQGFTSYGIVFEAQTVAIARNAQDLSRLAAQTRTWQPVRNPRNIRAWSDDYSNILEAMK